MNDRLEFTEVETDEEASFLMPGHDDRLHLVLFCDADAPAVAKAREFAPHVDIPEEWNFVRLDTDGAAETARWFGVSDTSGMAVVGDGSLLAIEYECSLEAFRRLIDIAVEQSETLNSLG